MEVTLLKEAVIIFGLSVGILYLCYQIKIPSIIGFILTGILAGPYFLGLVDPADVRSLAEIGIILLLFTIGIEFSLKNLIQIKKYVIMGGALQILLTTFIIFLIATGFGEPVNRAVFLGFMVSLSSTAIVLKIFQDRAELESPHGRISLGILIFQDIAIVLMILFTPILAGKVENLGYSILVSFAKGAGIILFIFISLRWLVPQILYQIIRTRSRELFLLVIIFLCLSTALLTYNIGLSLALGAFLAGLIISESEYSHQALDDILPFRDIFLSFFFISVGMLLNVEFFIKNVFQILLIFTIVMAVKIAAALSTTLLIGYPLRTAILVSFAIFQVGEFSFILSLSGIESGLLNETTYQLFVSAFLMTMAITPLTISFSNRIAEYFQKIPALKDVSLDVKESNHLIIVGYGFNGRNLANTAKIVGIPYVVIEMNPETVRIEREKGENIFYGDATRDIVLKKANIKDAKIIVVAINDAAATRNIVKLAKSMNPEIHVIARTRFLTEIEPLRNLGADEVIPEEFETTVEILSRVLKNYQLPKNEIEKFIAALRAESYEALRDASIPRLSELGLPAEIATLKISENSLFAGKTLSEIGMRRKYGVTLLAVVRGSEVITNPHGDFQLLPDDLIAVFGTQERIAGLPV